MAESLVSRLKNAWNVFRNKDPSFYDEDLGPSSYYNPARTIMRYRTDRSLIMSIYNRIALDVSTVPLSHVRVDDDNRYVETIPSSLNNCLSLEANIDQTGKAFIIDAVISMLDEGHVALVPICTSSMNLRKEDGVFDVYTMRVGKVVEWRPQHVAVEVYDELSGQKQKLVLPKRNVPIIENPFFSVMNAPNSTLQRLLRKLAILDIIDEQSGSGKLDLIIQLPYAVKTDLKSQQAETRRGQIEQQLKNSKYGIAYIDSTEHVTQLNRPVENNLMAQIEYLTSMLYSQLGLTQAIMDGTADEKAMVNYYNRIIEPILSAFADEMKRKFLSPKARGQGQTICFYRNLFKLMPISQIAEVADKLRRNEILSCNEIRQELGIKPSDDPSANEIRNPNLNQTAQGGPTNDSEIQNEEGSEPIEQKT